MSDIKLIKGNIFVSDKQTIVNTVNCVGVMGKGVALGFRLRYPEMFLKYQELCKNRLLNIGKLWLYNPAGMQLPWVLCFPTKIHWKYPSQIEYIEAGLKKFVETYKMRGITSVAFPLLGTHNGGLDKIEVLNLMYSYLSQCDIDIDIYEYDPTAPDELFDSFKLKWQSISTEEKRRIGIRMTQIETINKAINENTLQSMTALAEYEGIGAITLQKCFDMVMNCIVQPSFDFPDSTNE